MCELGQYVGLYTGPLPELDEISVNLDDGVFTDRHAELDYWMKMVAAGFASQELGIEKTLNVTPEEAKKELAKINGELPPENDAELSLYNHKKEEDVKDA